MKIRETVKLQTALGYHAVILYFRDTGLHVSRYQFASS